MNRPPFPRQSPPQPSGPVPPGLQTLRGIVGRFTYQNEEGFSIARFVAETAGGGLKAKEEVVLTGSLPGVEAGASLEVTGEWVRNPKFGIQFALQSFRPIPPSSVEGIRAFLGSGLIAGIGKEYAGRIVGQFSEKTLEIIDREPERLLEVEGIGPKRFERIVTSWKEHRDVADIMQFLQSYGISSTWATRIYKIYGSEAVNVLTKNPYRLAIDIRGIGFKSADKIALKAGMAHDAPERVQAGVLHLLREAAGDGHTFFPFDELSVQALEILGIEDPVRIRQATSELCKPEMSAKGPLVVAEKLPEGNKAVYLRGLHHAETGVAAHVAALCQTGKALPKLDIQAELAVLQRESRIELAGQQIEAVRLALRGGMMVLTGGPGTGKTTTVRTILEALVRNRVMLALAAPTGRAAKRLSETTHMEAATLHRLLKWDPRKGIFSYNESNPLRADYVIVDEASMLDVTLTHQLLKALAPTTSLLLVGDVDQLPSVGAGNVLRDLIDSGTMPVVRLDTIFRQARQSLIVLNAHRINQGEFPLLAPPEEGKGRKPDFFFVQRESPEEAVETIRQLVCERIPQSYGVDAIRDIQVITPMHRGILGAGNLNIQLQQALNQDPRSLTRGDIVFKVGDKVMQTENDYDKDVFNGDIGIIHTIDRVDHWVRVKFDRRIVEYPFSDLDELVLSYAITVHKSQGSEYPVVVLPVHTQHYIMLKRNLLYTAVTRGKRLVVCVGTKKAMFLSVKNADLSERHSGLRQRLQHLLPVRFPTSQESPHSS